MTPRVRRWGGGLLVLAALVVGRLVDQALPTQTTSGRPFERVGAVGETVSMRTHDVTVEEVTGAKWVKPYLNEMTTPGVWLVARVRVVGHNSDSALAYSAIRDASGRVWEGTGRSRSMCRAAPPGVPMICTVFIDVPLDAAPTAELLLATDPADTRFDDLAVVPLRVTAEQAKTWSESTRALTIPDPGPPEDS